MDFSKGYFTGVGSFFVSWPPLHAYARLHVVCIFWSVFLYFVILWSVDILLIFLFIRAKFSSLQCHNGHTLCSTCKTRVHNRCPTCRQELGDIRCLALEKVAESLELPCKYYSLGCPEIFPYYSKLKHESVCNFRPYNCPYAGSECSVVGDIPFLVAHLRDDHKVDMHTGCTFNHRYVKSNPREVENATWMLTVSFIWHLYRLIGFCNKGCVSSKFIRIPYVS